MFGFFVNLNLEPGHEQESVDFLSTEVIPALSQAPGLVAGYWWRSENGQGYALTVFETEETARAAADMASSGQIPMPSYVSMAKAEVVKFDVAI